MASSRQPASVQQRRVGEEALIANDFVAFTRLLVAEDGVLDVYIHRSADPIELQPIAPGESSPEAVPLDRGLSQLLEDSIQALAGLLNLQFRLVSEPDTADVRLIGSDRLALGSDGEDLLGLALPREAGRLYWDVWINGSALRGDPAYRGYTGIHEFAHVLGLEHLFDGSDGDRFGSRSPWRSLFPDETVMAYRSPRAGMGWPQSYRRNDLNALGAIWGLQPGAQLPLDSRGNRRLQGSPDDDVLIGSPAADRIRGFTGDDLLIDGSGADRLEGGLGANVYRCESDRQRDWVWITPDGELDVIRSLGPEDRVRLLGASARDLTVAITASETARYGTLPGTGVWVAGSLELLVADPSVQLEQVQRSLGLLSG